MNLIKTSLGLMLFASALTAHAQKSIKAPAGGKQISNELIGIFFEDISSSADGGLYAELLQNGSSSISLSATDGARQQHGVCSAQATRSV